MLSAPEFRQKQIVFALLSHGEKLSFKNDNIVISDEDGVKYQSTCYRLFALFIVGHVSITSGLLHRAKRFGFSIHLLSHNLSPFGAWNSAAEGNVLLRKKQYLHHGTQIARHLVKNKINSQIMVLKQIRKKPEALKKSIRSLKDYQTRLEESSLDLYQILGIEGIASRTYFAQLFDEMDWHGRKPRVKSDITNFLLDIGYTQLFNLVDSLLNLYGFDVYQGVYHQTFYQRKSLVCDLVEPFRPIVDKQIRKSYRLGQINPDDFNKRNSQYRLSDFSKNKHYTSLLLEAILEYKNDVFLYIQNYYRCFMRGKPISEYPVFDINNADNHL